MNEATSDFSRVAPNAPHEGDPPQADPGADPPAAKVKPSWWLGWIWLLPIAALAIVGYLGTKAWTSSGPTVHVIFPGAADIKAGNTKVKFQNQEVGDVESVTLQNDLEHTDVVLSLHPQLAGHLGPDTRFWIAGGHFSLNDLSELKTLVSGPFIGMDPRPGKETHRFTGLEQQPVLAEQPAGHHYHLRAPKLGTISRDSSVLHLGVEVGKVLGTSMAADGNGVMIEAFVRAPYDQLVHEGTRFWDASAIHLATGGSGPRVQFQSLPALVSGAIAFATPPEAETHPVAGNDATFDLYEAESSAENAPSAQALAYRVTFSNPSGSLAKAASVTLAGRRVGSVGDASLDYDANDGKLLLHATLMLEPDRLPLGEGSGSPRQRLDAMLERLISQGLRAGMESSPPVVGSEQVALRFVPNAAASSLGSGDKPEIPTTSGAGVENIMTQASDVMAKVNALPMEQIADNLRQTTERLAALSTSPDVTASLRHLNESLANIQRLSGSMNREVPPALARLNEAARSAQALVGEEGEVSNQPQTSTLPSTLFEVRRAARSIRELADAIDRNPQSLLVGKGSGR